MAILYASEDNKQPVRTTLTSQKSAGVNQISVASLEGWRKGAHVPFILQRFLPGSTKVEAGSQSNWTGVVSESGNTISDMKLTGGQDITYPSGSAVVATITSQWGNEVAATLSTLHNDDGTLKSDVIGGEQLKDNSVSGNKLADNSVPTSKMKYDESTDTSFYGEISNQVYGASEDIVMNYNEAVEYHGLKYENGKITIEKAGWYMMSATVTCIDVDSWVRLSFRSPRGGGAQSNIYAKSIELSATKGGTAGHSGGITTVAKLDAGAELWVNLVAQKQTRIGSDDDSTTHFSLKRII